MNNCFGGKFQGMRVLVTGHTGFKGSWLSIWLLELGAEVIGYSLEPPTNPSNFELCGLEKKMVHIHGDVCDQQKLQQTIEQYKPEIVFHLAAQSLVLVAYREPKETFQTNAMGTICVLEAIRQTSSVKVFVGITSDKVYEDQGWYWGYRENDRLGGYDPYSTSKAMTELAISSYRRSWSQKWRDEATACGFSKHPVAIASARAGNVIGGGDFAKYRLLPDFMRACMAGQKMEMRNPDSIRPWQHLLEPLSGYLLLAMNLLQRPEEFSEAWNFGPAERDPVTCETLISKAAELWEGSGYSIVRDQPEAHETHVLRVNWDSAAYRLDWAPAYTWQDAVNETVQWWKKYKMALSTTAKIDMYDVCADHIREYVEHARDGKISWTNFGK